MRGERELMRRGQPNIVIQPLELTRRGWAGLQIHPPSYTSFLTSFRFLVFVPSYIPSPILDTFMLSHILYTLTLTSTFSPLFVTWFSHPLFLTL